MADLERAASGWLPRPDQVGMRRTLAMLVLVMMMVEFIAVLAIFLMNGNRPQGLY